MNIEIADPDESYGDPLSAPFWQAARENRFVLPHCSDCGQWEFFARPFCLRCGSDKSSWKAASGRGSLYSVTTVHMRVAADLQPPYQVGIVELDEGPRMLAGLEGERLSIGDSVRLLWRERVDGPPLPIFTSSRERS